jgi:predicted MFS family arabinose efflux permease
MAAESPFVTTGNPASGVATAGTTACSQHTCVSPWSLYGTYQRWGFLTVLYLVTTSNYFDYYVLSVVLEPIKHEFHVSDTMLGLLSGFCFALVYAVAGLPIARWADRGNRRTVITLALAGWSVMTVACGLAQSFWQLAAARFGLGIVEPGAMPPAQSLVADYFPPARRATAIGILNSGNALGYLVGIGLGGYIAANAGWRTAFLLAGAPGLILAVIVRLILDEPRRELGFPKADPGAESLGQSLRRLRRKRSFVWSIVGVSVYTVFAYGINIFLPSFMIRTMHATLQQVSVMWGCAASAATLIGTIAGGWLADRLGSRDVRWYAWLPTIACALGVPLYWLALSADNLRNFVAADFVAELVLAIGLPAFFAAAHAVCGAPRRAMAIGIVFFSISFLGGGFGPLVAGALSDALGAAYGLESLRYSLMSMLVFLVPASIAFHRAGLTIRSDRED